MNKSFGCIAALLLASAGLRPPAVRGVFLSRLHFDHTAGMLTFIGLRMQFEARGTLWMQAPAGTQEFVDGLLAAAVPAIELH